MSHREFKDPLYTEFARIGHAVSSPKRIELLDLLGQGEKTVEQLADQSSTAVKNTSAHLRALREARLVETRRDGPYVYYRLANDAVIRFVRQLQALARSRLAEVDRVARLFIDGRDELEPVGLDDLRRLVRDQSVTLIDVRPRDEYDAGHIPGAVSMPVSALAKRVDELPKRREVIAYCRGPYCLYSVEAVALLRAKGFRARRAEDGLPDWQAAGWPVTREP
jgi:rhodanese-related sulfurtransferase